MRARSAMLNRSMVKSFHRRRDSESRVASYRLTLAYDGTAYVGWQFQRNGLAIQQVLGSALEKLIGQKIRVHGSGRTDAGVHAERQCVSFQIPKCPHEWKPRELQRALNAVLPRDIRVLKAQSAKPDFNARFSSKGKIYRYQVFCGPVMSPFLRRYALHHPELLDVKAMRQAARLFVGKHNFSALSADSGREVETPVRRVKRCSVGRSGPMILIRVTADGFLYKMVRSMVGALLKIGEGRATVEQLAVYFRGRRRTAWVETASAHGLFLEKVRY